MQFEDKRLPSNSFYLFSYPRSGSNWLLSALAYLLGGTKAEARIPPDLYPHRYGLPGTEDFWIQAAAEWIKERPMLIKSHDSVELVNALYPKGKKLYLLRDGRDALISYYFYGKAFITNPTNKTVFSTGRQQQDLGAVSGNDVRFDADEYVAFLEDNAHDWVSSVRGWASEPGVLNVRYELLQQNFEQELIRIIGYLALPSVRTLQEVREEYVDYSRSLLTGDNRAFQRKGIVGDWKNYCNQPIRDTLKHEIGPTLVALGYEADLDW